VTEPEPYSVLNLSEIEPIPAAGVLWKPLRRTLGIDAFGINAYSAAAAGEHVVEEHTEETLGHQEAYVVVAGHATFTLDGVDLDAPNGTVVFIRDPSIRRHAVAVVPETTVLAIGGVPGVHAPSAWEWYFAAEQYRSSGDHGAALELLADGLERFPDNPSILYSIACWEAMAGNTDAAITALTSAFDLDPRSRDWAKGDADLDSIRGLPGSPV
jgi:tetratricopeptide (TPR) repeat protein